MTRIKNMDLIDLIWHLAGFLAPALFVAPLVVGLSLVLGRKRAAATGWRSRIAINLTVCVAVLVLGLVLTGQDGRMLTYGALVLASAATAWWRPARR